MKNIFTDALCTLLEHPRKCPHGHSIPKGKCCN
jgi:DtxR family transcriptional regulator, Mn-dependent transcriptional regulator